MNSTRDNYIENYGGIIYTQPNQFTRAQVYIHVHTHKRSHNKYKKVDNQQLQTVHKGLKRGHSDSHVTVT